MGCICAEPRSIAGTMVGATTCYKSQNRKWEMREQAETVAKSERKTKDKKW